MITEIERKSCFEDIFMEISLVASWMFFQHMAYDQKLGFLQS